MNIGTGIVEQIKRIGRPTTPRSRSLEDFPLREPYVQQQVSQIESTLHQQQYDSQKLEHKQIEYHELSPPPSKIGHSRDSASSKARWKAANEKEIAAAQLELLQAELKE